ncbi:putative transcription factor [Smittium culicis]|uniref:Putative transcription factor n=1 Tax=Smittium culicis TaxID=133412 RepID=A0A1R1YPI5_9FUNG|nr:putative transcription factor [Smittium culicis]
MSDESKYQPTGIPLLPISRVKRIIKEDKSVQMINSEAVFLMTKAVELFIRKFANEALNYSKSEKRKTIFYKDAAKVVQNVDSWAFLEDIIPPTISAKKLKLDLEQTKPETS